MPSERQPRVAVITGASSGIGLVAAKALAAKGWRVIALGRDPGRCAAAEAEIRAAAGPGGSVEVIRGDLSLVADASRLAGEIAARTDRIDALLNNAGGAAKAKEITAEGLEATFTSNHLGHFVMTEKLLPLLKAAAAGQPPGAVRILNVASSAHEHTPGIDWDDLQSVRDFAPMRAYCNAKLANVLFTRELARRLAGSGIVVHAIHPGAVDTNFIARSDEATQAYMRANPDLRTAEQGADTLIWLVDAPEAGRTSGGYWHERQEIPPSAAARDPASAERLWRESETLAGALAG